jgi:predicted acyl esterase
VKIELDVVVPTRVGRFVSVNLFTPDGHGPWPVIATMSPYGKDVHWPDRYPLYDQADQEPHAVWETPSPQWWTARGYAIVRADSPGTGKSPGPLDLLGPIEVGAFHDVIEWAGVQPWSTGRIGSLGISWLAMLQWLVAAQRPPHLAAIVPWEGASDAYREFGRHGGIFANSFLKLWWNRQIEPQRNDPAAGATLLFDEMQKREFIDDWYRARTPDLARIEVPVLAGGNWGSLHLHQRGILEGFLHAASPVRQLIVSSGTHIGPFYAPWAKERQLRFLDRWLKGEPNGAEYDPPVRLAVRVGTGVGWRDETEWPIARTRWRRLHLDAATRSLTFDAPLAETNASYCANDGELDFAFLAASEVEFTGPMAARLWVSSTGHDLDVFLHFHVVDRNGNIRVGTGPQGAPIPLAMGWLRASHRALDVDRSLPYRPVHRHTSASWLVPGEPVALDVEIWPTSITLAAGERLVMRVRASDDDLGVISHDDPQDRGALRSLTTTIHTGGRFDSALLLPMIPPRENG